MSTGLDWRMDEDGGEPPEFKRGRWPVTSLALIAAVLVVIALALGIWGAGREQAEKNEQRLEDSVQDLLDVLHRAYLAGDGDLFFANQSEDPAWLSAQLRPENQIVYLAGPKVTRVEQFGNDLWANIQWQQADSTLQRVAFFRWRDGRLIQVPTVEGYWYPVEEMSLSFGRLRIHEVDAGWRRDIAAFVTRVIAETCGPGSGGACRAGSRPFTLTIAPDFRNTAEPNQIRVPSPRLIGLDQRGRPSSYFWSQLRRALEAHLTRATIRFVVPEEFQLAYQDASSAFAAEQPDVRVEIIPLESLPAEPLAWPLDIDGAALTPDERLITAGRVLNLTDYLADDPEFDEGDFYEQIWQGAWWRDRMWFMPQAADMRLLFYDRQAYEQAAMAEPSLRWTWQEMVADLNGLAERLGEKSYSAVFLDTSRDTLYSYAYNLDNPCPGQATVFCTTPLSSEAMAATLEWYRSLSAPDSVAAELSGLSAEERDFLAINLTTQREVVIWTERPVFYELHMLRDPTGVVPFPGSERFDSITPLWIQGSYISQLSRHPLATWQWLKFLSYQSLARQKRLVPARPSVAVMTDYWGTLPRPVSEAMRIAFPFARPVLIEEQGYFPWRQLAAVSSGALSPAEAIQSPARLRWFGRPLVR